MDDDLLSLDFTIPGATPPPAETPEKLPAALPTLEPVKETAAPVPFELALEPLSLSLEAAPLAVAVEPVALAPIEPPVEPVLPSRPLLPVALVEAAALHAAGQELEALRRLESALKSNEDLGGFVVQIWAGLFDLLQSLGRRAAFDALALAFAKRFEKSPPPWTGAATVEGEAHLSSGGRAYVALVGMLDASVGDTLKHAMKLAQTSSVVRLDLAKLVDVDNDGCTLVLRALAALKKAKKEYLLGAPEHLAGLIAAKLTVGTRSHESMWMLLLELYQQAFRQDLFEDAAVNFAVTFEVSPPSWEPPQVAAASAAPAVVPAKSATQPAKAEGFVLRGQMIGAAASEFAALEAAVASRNEFVLDGRNLVRIDAASAKALLEVLTPLAASGKKIGIAGLSTLVAAYLESIGYADVVELRARTI